MDAREHFDEAPLAAAPPTLGDVLYAKKSQVLVSEAEWAALVRCVAAGDPVALHALYDRAHRLVFTLAVRITLDRETAEELTVDVFHDVWRRASAYDPANGTVLGWIMNQARSRAIDRVRFDRRKKRVAPWGADATDAVEAADPRELLETKQAAGALRAALAVLSPGERQAIESAFFAGLTHAEAALQSGEPLGTVKTRIRSALHKLRQAMDGGGLAP
jgi:RNA polymerase sigma-70 factor, ECF subfamily